MSRINTNQKGKQTEQGSGIIVDELLLEIEINYEDCSKACEGTYFFVRQPDKLEADN